MDKLLWQSAKSLFAEALATAPPDRARLLHLHAQQPEMVELVVSMLAADERIESDRTIPPAIAELDSIEHQADQRLVGTVFGAYRVLRTIGHGGMGSVYLAERSDAGVVQRVALKLIRSARLDAESQRRFLDERRLLARLNHPNIARLIDFGTVEGTPYYAMEYVDGPSLTSHCDQHRLPLRKRLELLQKVAAAAAHAHRMLVVHRDIKPSNILVDSEGEPRLLDFGIAKALDPVHSPDRAETGTHNRFLSPYCAAPEMLRGEPVTTACDTYALGAVMYALICGQPPLIFGRRHMADIEAVVLHQIPKRPSERIADMESDVARQIASDRGCASAQALAGRLCGDLDTLALRALAKEPDRRYPSAEAFAEDIGRYLQDLPLRARPDARWYRVRKFLRRHRWPVSVTLALFAGVVATTASVWRQSVAVRMERDVAQVERAHAEAIGQFMVDTFALADPSHTLGEQITARQILDQGVARLDAQPDQSPQTKLRLLMTMARAYLGLGQFEQAADLGRRAADAADTDAARSDAHRLLADSLNAQGRFAQALVHAQSASGDGQAPAEAWLSLAPILANLGRGDEATHYYRKAVEALRLQQPESVELASAMAQYGRRLRNDRKYEAASELLEEALRIQRLKLPNNHPAIADTLGSLAAAEQARGRLERAIPLARESLAMNTNVYGQQHPVVGRSWMSLGNALEAAGEFSAATDAMEQSLLLLKQFHGVDSPQVAMAHYNLGRVYHKGLGDLRRAEAHFRAAYDAGSKTAAANNLNYFRLGLGMILNLQNRTDEARPLLEDALRSAIERTGADSVNAAFMAAELGETSRRDGDFEAATELLEQAIPVLEGALGADSEIVERARSRLDASRTNNARPILMNTPS